MGNIYYFVHNCNSIYSGNFLTTEDFSSGLTITADGSLYIQSSEIADEGNYSCVASNDAGNSRKSIRLIIHGEC